MRLTVSSILKHARYFLIELFFFFVFLLIYSAESANPSSRTTVGVAVSERLLDNPGGREVLDLDEDDFVGLVGTLVPFVKPLP